MNTPFESRGRAVASLLAVLVVAATSLLGPSTAGAFRDASYGEGHQLRVEERLARRAQRASVREARRAERETRRSERADRRSENLQRRTDRETARAEGEIPQGTSQTGGCRLSIAASAGRLIAGESATLSGSVTCSATAADTSTSTEAPVQIYELVKGARPHVALLVKTLTTSGDGSFETTSTPLSANTIFEARQGSAQASVAIKVAPAVTLTATAQETGTSTGTLARTRPSETTFSGTVTPAVSGMLVALQVSTATGQRWRTVGWTHTAADGSYSLDHVLRRPGTTSLRTLVHPRNHLTVGISETLSLRGASPQRTALTIETSADPVADGQAVQISGTAAGASGTTVKLLGHSSAGWTLLGTTITDEAGHYSFEETPGETTFYRVADATAASKLLRQQVSLAIAPAATPTSATTGEAVDFAGTVAPAQPGTQVELEALGAAGASYQPIAVSTVGSVQDYSILHAFAPGTYTLRIRAIGDWAHTSAATSPFVLTVTP